MSINDNWFGLNIVQLSFSQANPLRFTNEKKWTNDIRVVLVINGSRLADCSSEMSSEEASTAREINFRRL